MSKPESYPFLRIARQFNVDYSDVLQHAGALQHYNGRQVFDTGQDVELAIYDASLMQVRIRDGEIDWQTGERL